MKSKFVYMFSEGDVTQRNLLGGKGANLAEMTNMGLPIPQGFIVTTDACVEFYDKQKVLTDVIKAEIEENMRKLEEIAGKKFGDNEDPLLVSVRSGARVSMPGMMDTILNLGLNDVSVEGLAIKSGNPRFAYDSYRRFIQMFGDVVMDIDRSKFEAIIETLKEARGAKGDADLTDQDIKEMVTRFKALYKQEIGNEFPQDPVLQLMKSIEAVFRSWMNPRAVVYRRMHGFESKWGTAVNVQQMVFGNMGPTSGTGVAFTRNPATGENVLYGEYLIDAQGEDVVAGIRTPNPISQLANDMPEVFKQFNEIAKGLEAHYKDMQDMEFTVQDGHLYILQTRRGKRTVASALKIAVDLVAEGMLSKEEALLQVDPSQLNQLLHPMFDQLALKAATIIGRALPASPGAATGNMYLTSEAAKAATARGEDVILVRLETSPEDIEGMVVAKGILTARGGMTSHAAVVARGMGICCVSGCGELRFSPDGQSLSLGGKTYKEGDPMSLDGTKGNIYGEAIATVDPEITGDFETFMAWADEIRTMKVRANADSPADARNALKFGAEGIGLTRTEHMFFQEDRIMKMRTMIVAKSEEKRKEALDLLLPLQKEDFIGIYEVMGELPVTIRLLDPPFHEFLPQAEEDIKELAVSMGISFDELKGTVDSLHEFNPMMGHRGCRLAVSYPEIAQMQTKAIIEAALQIKKEKGFDVMPEIMIPLIGDLRELQYVKDIVTTTANDLIAASGTELKYSVGTMIEIPRATLLADQIAQEAEFFSFGTNDLTQMTFGFSRDDANRFLGDYYDKNIYTIDPFAHIDQTGVGQLMELAVSKGRQTRPDIKLGICGEHGGDPSSVEFCHSLGLSYVSCSPFRVPIARLAAAHAALKNK